MGFKVYHIATLLPDWMLVVRRAEGPKGKHFRMNCPVAIEQFDTLRRNITNLFIKQSSKNESFSDVGPERSRGLNLRFDRTIPKN